MNKIEVNGKTIEIKDPTVTDWANVMKYKTILDEEELYYKMLQEFTGLDRDELLSQDETFVIRIEIGRAHV